MKVQDAASSLQLPDLYYLFVQADAAAAIPKNMGS